MPQSGRRKEMVDPANLLAWHAPEVNCINKGRARTPYEVGVKVGFGARAVCKRLRIREAQGAPPKKTRPLGRVEKPFCCHT